jgi:hypothetical protein
MRLSILYPLHPLDLAAASSLRRSLPSLAWIPPALVAFELAVNNDLPSMNWRMIRW